MITNEQRAYRAWMAARCYQTTYDSSDSKITDETITDLLTDLMHFCDEQGIEFESCLRMANTHYEDETTSSEDDSNKTTTILQHTIEYWWRDGYIQDDLDEASIDHIHEQIIDGFGQGELCTVGEDDEEHFGWWKIQ
jgi:hypothetical protein